MRRTKTGGTLALSAPRTGATKAPSTSAHIHQTLRFTNGSFDIAQDDEASA
jgi:hypothetical protein